MKRKQYQFRPKEKSKKLGRLFLDTERALKGTKREHVVVMGGKVLYKAGTGIYSVQSLGKLREELKERADKSERKRAIYSFSPKPPGGVERVHQLKFIKKGSYIPPHAHPSTVEKWRAASGKFKAIIFDAGMSVRGTRILTPRSKTLISKPGEYHTLVALESGSILHEEVPAKYDSSGKVMARWAPAEGTPEVGKFQKALRRAKTVRVIDLNNPVNMRRLERQMDKLLREKPRKLTAAEKRQKAEDDARWESILENIKRDQPLLDEYKKKIDEYKQGKISREELNKAYNEMWKKLEARDLVNWKNVMR